MLSAALFSSSAVNAEESSGGESHHNAGNDQQPDVAPQISPAGAKEILARQAVGGCVSLKHSGEEQRRCQKEHDCETHPRSPHGGHLAELRAQKKFYHHREIEAVNQAIGEEAVIEDDMGARGECGRAKLRQNQVQQPEPDDVALVAPNHSPAAA